MQNFHFDLETSDPDDIFSLALLATHPRSNLVGVTIHPGGEDQVGLVKYILNRLGKNVPVGAGTPKKPNASHVSEFHYAWLGKIPSQKPEGSAVEIIKDVLRNYPDTHLITGAALTNIYNSSKEIDCFFTKWTCQGGFAGDNIVPEHLRLDKFKGKQTCPTFNLNGDSKASKALLCGSGLKIASRKLVSKNVCHGVFWTPEFTRKIPDNSHPGLALIKDGMQHYFKKNPNGKALHDVIAATAALSPNDIGTWVKVNVYRDPSNGEWGCWETQEDTSSEILIELDNSKFQQVLEL